MAAPVQVACRKQGTYEQGNWTTRVLTLDPEKGTLAISRKNKPSNVYYHAMELKRVQMWPHYSSQHIVSDFKSVKAMTILRVVGVDIPGSKVRHAPVATEAAVAAQRDDFTAIAQQVSPTGADGRPPSPSSEDELPASPLFDTQQPAAPQTQPRAQSATGSKPHSPLAPITQQFSKGSLVYWMLRFDNFESFETTVSVLSRMKDKDGVPRKFFNTTNVLGDFERIKKAYQKHAASNDVVRVAAKRAK